MYTNDITATFCFVDDFIKSMEGNVAIARIAGGNSRGPRCRMCISEVATILLSYHTSGYACFKHYYLSKVMVEQDRDFNLVSYP